MTETFFTADLHLSHRSIPKYSGRFFCINREEKNEWLRLAAAGDTRMKSLRISDESIARMNDYLINQINKIVGERDELWLLGDFYFKHNLQELYDFRGRIKCNRIHLVIGNHDTWFLEQQPKFMFTSIQDVAFPTINCQRIFMSHYAHVVWPKSHKKSWQIFGHSHSSLNPWIANHMPNSRMLDVGVDNAYRLLGEYRPFSFEEIRDYMKNKSGESLDHHTDDIGDGENDI